MKLLSSLALFAIVATFPAAVQAKPIQNPATTAVLSARQAASERSTSEVRSSCQQGFSRNADARGKEARSKSPRYEQAPRLCGNDKPSSVDERIK